MRYTLALFAILTPLTVFAAGFAKGSLFLSQPSVIEGETVFIHAVVSNDTNLQVDADVVFKEDDKKIGSSPVTLTPGEAATVSLSWKPEAGAHHITAEFTSKAGTIIETQSANFTIAAKLVDDSSNDPQPAAQDVQTSYDIQKLISSFSPTTAEILKPAFTFIDSARAKGASALDSQIAGAKEKVDKTPKPGIVAGSDTGDKGSSMENTFWFVLYTLYLYFLTIVRWLLANAAIFYPLVVLIFFYLAWKGLNRIRRPSGI
ncbi:Ig-like domain-containing protein [Candidatus Parcubacteria bacterium]|nr:Ig-like domain-containing protein [Candidatus Parcubacteria bacterium]